MIEDINEEESIIIELFGVSISDARDALNSVGTDTKRLRKYFSKRKKSLGKCKLCGKKLTDADSVARGYGPECYKKVHGERRTMLEV